MSCPPSTQWSAEARISAGFIRSFYERAIERLHVNCKLSCFSVNVRSVVNRRPMSFLLASPVIPCERKCLTKHVIVLHPLGM